MIKKLFIITLIVLFTQSINTTTAFENDDNYFDNNYENIESGETYCTPQKTTIKDKLKNAFIGQPTGFTPQIQPSPYLTPNYGPSYMQGYYSGNVWNSHNIYNPIGGMRLLGTSF